MDRVAAEIAQEIGVLFQYDDVDTGACQQIAADHAGGSTACDDTAGGKRLQASPLANTSLSAIGLCARMSQLSELSPSASCAPPVKSKVTIWRLTTFASNRAAE